MPIPDSGSLTLLMQEVVALEELVNVELDDPSYDSIEKLRVYEWRPQTIQLPAIYNWTGATSPYERRTVAHGRDELSLLIRVVVRHTDSAVEMRRLTSYIDALRHVVDRELAHGQPLGGYPQKADRTGMRLIEDKFNQVVALGAEFPISVSMDRVVVD